jgi:outer membrane protein assembly factor BamB
MINLRFLICVVTLVTFTPTGDCRAADWPAFGRDRTRNAVSPESDPPTDWDVKTGRNIKWQAEIASAAFGTPVVSDGLVWIGGNRWRPGDDEPKDAALLLCFDEQTGEKLYEYVSPRLASGWYTDPAWHGLGSSPLIEGDRLWFVSNRCETVCLDISPLKAEPHGEPTVVWKVDMRDRFGVAPHQPYMGPSRLCSIAPSFQGLIFVSTANGVDQSHVNIPAPQAPALICFDKETGESRWQVPTGENVLVSEVAAPLVAEIAGRGQVIMPHGDGWIRSYDPRTGRLLWEFDINSKESLFSVGGRSRRNFFLATPVLYEDRIYIASGQDYERGEGDGRLICIDPTGTGDISSELAVDSDGNSIPPRRIQNVDTKAGERAIPNPDSGLIWEYTGTDVNGNRKIDYEEQMHRTIGNVVIRNGLLLVADYSGVEHCLDARTGECHWTYDSFTQVPASPLIVDDTAYVGTEDGTVLLFHLSAEESAPFAEIDVNSTIYAAPVFANGVLYLTSRNRLNAIQQATTH